jgi:hypothetical protein
MEGELKNYWEASSAARGMARTMVDKAADYAEAIDDLTTIEVMTDWETLRTAVARNLANIPALRKRQLAVAG